MRPPAEARLGFYPVANEALSLLAASLTVEGDTSILDPCAGQGAAIKHLGQAIGVGQERTWAIELAENRAGDLAENLPDAKRLAPCSFMSSQVSPNSFGFAWVNSPFQDELGGGKRVEYSFLTRATSLLVKGGVMAFLMPERAMDHSILTFFGQHYEQCAQMELPAEHRAFDEVMLVGKKRDKPIECYESIPERYLHKPGVVWTIPAAKGPRTFVKTGPTEQELERLLERSPLNRAFIPPREQSVGRPPLPLGKGHLALLLASGQLNGLVPSEPPHIVRGTSHKEPYVSEVKSEENEKGECTTTTVIREKVVLVVRTVSSDGIINTLEG